jgi:hypothetical protein
MRAALKHIADASDCLDDSPDQIALHVIGCMGALGMFQAGVAERHEVTPAMVEAAAQVLWGIGADPWRERFAAWQHPSLIAITHAALQSAARAGGEV